jgi:hypothetical protein
MENLSICIGVVESIVITIVSNFNVNIFCYVYVLCDVHFAFVV